MSFIVKNNFFVYSDSGHVIKGKVDFVDLIYSIEYAHHCHYTDFIVLNDLFSVFFRFYE